MLKQFTPMCAHTHTHTHTKKSAQSCSVYTHTHTPEAEMNDGERAASLKARCSTNCDYQLWFPPSICFNLFKRTEAHFILIKIDEMAWNQLSHTVAALTTVRLLPRPTGSRSPLRSHTPPSSLLPLAWLLYIAVSISALPGGAILSQ